MSKPFNAFDWYWIKPDLETLYSSRRQAYVKSSDAEYIAWGAEGGQATLWPRNENGEQTDAALQDVLGPYGLALPGHVIVPASVLAVQGKVQGMRTPGSSKEKSLYDDLSAAAETAGGEPFVWFSSAPTWSRNSSFLATLTATANITSSQVDDLFVAAAKIEV